MKKIVENGLIITDLTANNIELVANELTKWQNNKVFNNFLKEIPMNIEDNFSFLKHKILGEKSRCNILEVTGKVCGILLLHSFDKEEKSLEESIRVSPEFQGMGLGTTLKKLVLDEVLSNLTDIEKIISWHSAFNKGTFFTNKNCGGNIVDFVENQTFLPNLQIITDDFKWEITGIVNGKNRKINDIFSGENEKKIHFGLKKHNFIK